MSNLPHHHLLENPSGLEAKAHGHCRKQTPANRGVWATSPLTPQLISFRSGQKKHPIYPLCTLFNSTVLSWKTRVVEISVKLNVPTPWGIASYFSVNGAYDTIPGWQTPLVHVRGERTSSKHGLRLSARQLGCGATKTSLRCGRQPWLCFASVGDSYFAWALERTGLHRSKQHKKELKLSAPAFYVQAMCPVSAHCSRLVRCCMWYFSTPLATGLLVLHVPIAIWRSHMIYSWTKPSKTKTKNKAKPLSMCPREFLDTNCNADCSPD